jgi:hypothetical protein
MGTIQTIYDEITVDPLALGYAALITTPGVTIEGIHKDPVQQAINQSLADKLNALDTGIARQRISIPKNEIIAAFDPTEIDAVTAANAAKINWLPDDVNPNDQATRQILANAFGGASQTVANLLALENETISRATELGLNTVLPGWVAAARCRGL